MTPRERTSLTIAFLLTLATPVVAEVVRVDVRERSDVLGGRSFGPAGPNEKQGEIHFAFDPDNPYNARVVDLGLAPRSAEGRVEARADFMVLQPKAARRGRVEGCSEASILTSPAVAAVQIAYR